MIHVHMECCKLVLFRVKPVLLLDEQSELREDNKEKTVVPPAGSLAQPTSRCDAPPARFCVFFESLQSDAYKGLKRLLFTRTLFTGHKLRLPAAGSFKFPATFRTVRQTSAGTNTTSSTK